MPPRDAAHVAQHRGNAVCDAVGGDILPAVLVGPVVDVHGVDMRCAAPGGNDRQHARAAAHIESAAARDSEVEHRTRHKPRGSMVARAERHAGHHDYLHLARRSRIVERSADAQAAFDIDRREIALPHGIPIPGRDSGITPFDPAARQQGVDFGPASGQLFAGDIGFQRAAFLLETLEREIGEFGGQDFSLHVVVDSDIEDRVIHIM